MRPAAGSGQNRRVLARARALSAFQVDLVVAACLLVAGEAETLLSPLPAPRLVAALAIAIQAAAIAWRRRRPVVAASLVLAAQLGSGLLGIPANALLTSLVAVLLAMYSVGAQKSTRGSVAGLVVGTTVIAAAVLSAHKGVSDLGFGLLVVGIPWAIGRAMHGRGLEIARLESEQDELARRAVADERTRIARELHDVVAHAMGVMVVQAQGAERMLELDHDRAREALRSVQATGRDALEEMHRLVGILREGEPDQQLAPQGSLRHMDSLVDQVRAAGLDVILSSKGDLEHLPPGVDLAAYRILQEALTNALQHGGNAAEVKVERDARTLSIRVEDDGGREPQPRRNGGHGLVGMRERARLYGGSVQAGARPSGGFSVVASLPLR